MFLLCTSNTPISLEHPGYQGKMGVIEWEEESGRAHHMTKSPGCHFISITSSGAVAATRASSRISRLCCLL